MNNKNKKKLKWEGANIFVLIFLYCWVTIFFGMILLAIKVVFLNFIMFVSFILGLKFAVFLCLIIGIISLIGLFIILLLYFLIRFIQEKIVDTNISLRVVIYALGTVFSWLFAKKFFANLQDTNQLSNNQMFIGSVVSFLFILFLDYLYYNRLKFSKSKKRLKVK